MIEVTIIPKQIIIPIIPKQIPFFPKGMVMLNFHQHCFLCAGGHQTDEFVTAAQEGRR